MTIASTVRGSQLGTQLKGVKFGISVDTVNFNLTLALQYDSAKTAVEVGKVYKLTTPNATGETFGFNSQMYVAHKAVYRIVGRMIDVYAIPLAAPSTGSPAASTGDIIALSGTATKAGNFVFYAHGRKFSIAVSKDDTATVIGDAIVTALTAATDILLESPVNTSGTVAATATFLGTTGDDIRITGPKATDDQLPDGLSVTWGAVENGAGDESEAFEGTTGLIEKFIADSTWKTFLVTPSDSSTALDLIQEMVGQPDNGSNTGTGLYKDNDFRPCLNFVTNIGTLATVEAATSARTDDLANVMVAAPDRREMPFVISACEAARTAMSLNDNSASKLFGKSLYPSVDGPEDEDNDWTVGSSGADNLSDAVDNGITAITTDADGNSVNHDVVTMYRDADNDYPVWQYLVQFSKLWNIAKSLADDKVADDNDVMVEKKAEASLQPKATDTDTQKARIVKLVKNVWVPYGWAYNAKFTIDNMVVDEAPSGNPDRYDRYIPVILSANKRIVSDQVLIDRDTTSADLIVNVG